MRLMSMKAHYEVPSEMKKGIGDGCKRGMHATSHIDPHIQMCHTHDHILVHIPCKIAFIYTSSTPLHDQILLLPNKNHIAF